MSHDVYVQLFDIFLLLLVVDVCLIVDGVIAKVKRIKRGKRYEYKSV